MTPVEIAMVLCSALLHAIWSVSIKGSRDPLAFNLAQALPCALAAGVPLLVDPPTGLGSGFWLVLAGASLSHGLSFYWLSRAYQHADLSLVYPIARSTPAFLPLAAVPLLGEQISPLGGLAIVVVVAGLWLVPAGEGWSLARLRNRGTLFALATLVAGVGYGLTDKVAMVRLDAAAWAPVVPIAIYYFLLTGLGAFVVMAPLALRVSGLAPLREVWRQEAGRIGFAVLVSLGSYGLILETLRSAPASYVVALRQASVVFALILGVFWLGESPTPLRIAGAALTVLGVVLIGVAA